MNLNQITMPCADIDECKAFYLHLGFTLIVNSPDYLRFLCTQGGATFSLHKTNKEKSCNSAIVYFECDNLDNLYQALVAQGIAFVSTPNDKSWGWREARLLDPCGNQLCLYYAGVNRVNPPWRVTIQE